jgi:hypothetical protein
LLKAQLDFLEQFRNDANQEAVKLPEGYAMKKSMIAVLIGALLTALSIVSSAQDKKIKTGLTKEDWAYKLADGVTTREITYFSDGVACYAKLFFPKGVHRGPVKRRAWFSDKGWAGTHFSIDKYGARFAERGPGGDDD